MNNYVQPGHSLTLTAPSAGVESGKGVKIGNLFVVAAVTAASGESFSGNTVGVYELAKKAAEAWTEGAKIYWDDSGKACTTTKSTNLWIGHAVADAGANDPTGKVRLHGAPTAEA